ncbi:hypothetical protein N7481_008191 [Penicillium waksmanii]|uniref:uncharacterized protein n=1 Tax=Penicillium waksmanii TaxID=69791 RepID=UPI002546E3B0|nr:uncharacterized protein N7481_008191 [Penicillium waksmanii]KAJ5980893.1 hypothetical protein N7481_008191 [Penicillium waksmanii]
MEVLRTAPDTSSFVPIAEHQSRTPASFHDGPTVLHYHSQSCKVVILERDLVATPALNALRGENATNGSTVTEEEEKEVAIDNVETWVTSDKFLLFSSSASTGVSIPYPSISLHAIQRLRVPGASDDEVQGLYMQIATPSAPSGEDDEEECITMTVVLPSDATTSTASDELSDEPEESPIQTLYNAVSACSNLHPDPVEPGDEDDEEGAKFFTADGAEPSFFQLGEGMTGSENGGLPPPVDGSSGWITAENMDQFFDEEGNWIAGGEPPSLPLGPGAGNVHSRENEDEDGEQDGKEGADDDETKWRRTE